MSEPPHDLFFILTLAVFHNLPVKAFDCLVDLLLISASAYALLFILSFGLLLVDWLTSYVEEIKSLQEPAFGFNESCAVELMVDQFKEIKRCFEIYRKIAGSNFCGRN